MDYARSKRKENSPGSTRGRLWGNSRYRDRYEDLTCGPELVLRNAYRIPFRPMPTKRLKHTKGLPLGLGSTHSRTIPVVAEPFSTSGLQDPLRVFATTTKICTMGGSRQAYAQTLLRTPMRPLTHQCIKSHEETSALTAEYKRDASTPSILRASCFGR